MIQYVLLLVSKLNEFRKKYPGYTILFLGLPLTLLILALLYKFGLFKGLL